MSRVGRCVEASSSFTLPSVGCLWHRTAAPVCGYVAAAAAAVLIGNIVPFIHNTVMSC